MWLCREERLQHAREVLGGNSGSRIGDHNLDEAIDRLHRHRDPATVRRRLARVGEKIEEDLLETLTFILGPPPRAPAAPPKWSENVDTLLAQSDRPIGEALAALTRHELGI